MKKNVLVITSSPRKNGNSDMLASAFIEGARTAGHAVALYEAGQKNIKGCRACKKCYSKGEACIFNDGFNELAPLIEKADAVVWATPLYYFTFPAQIKAAIDKMYSFHVGERNIAKKESVLLACGETDAIGDFDAMVKAYQLITDYVEWKDRGIIIATNVNEKGDIDGNPTLKEARELGERI